ncbi:MAG: TolC family protein [candidate division Zixibacteria bacterium]|nr:TolC family protein [candidate division Zixibacteria bacterium]
MQWKNVLLLGVVLAAASAIKAASAAGPDQTTVGAEPAQATLEQLIDKALRSNPDIRALTADIAAAQGEVVTTSAWPNPEFSAVPGTTMVPEAGTQFHGTLELTQVFEFPGKRALRRAVVEKSVELRQLALEGFRFQLANQVRRVFYHILASHQVIELRQQGLALTTSFLEAAKKKVEGGFAPEFEVTKAEVEVVAAQKALRDAQAQHNIVHTELNELLGRRPDEPLEVTGKLEGTTPVFSDSSLYAQALALNPSLKIQAAAIERADLNLRSVRKSRLPDFTIGPNLEYARDGQIYGLGVSLPLPVWDRKRGPISTAAAEQQRATAEFAMLEQEVLRDVSAASQKLHSAKESLSYYTAEFRGKLKAALDAAAESYGEGRTTLLIYLETQRTYFDAQADYFETFQQLYDAQAELESALGVPLAELQTPNQPREKE